MKVNLKQVPVGGSPMVVRAQLDLSGIRLWGEYPLKAPVQVEASFQNKNGIITVDYTAAYVLEGPCARCAEHVEKREALQQSHTLVEKVEDERNDALISVPDGILPFGELVSADLCLELTGVLLCSPDCKGLCPICGANRNHSVCECAQPNPNYHQRAFEALLSQEDAK